MGEAYTIYFAIGSILAVVAQLIIIVGSGILVSKRKHTSTILMLTGCILSLFFTFLGFATSMLAAGQSPEAVLTWSSISAMLSPLPHLLFAIGLAMYAFKRVQKAS